MKAGAFYLIVAMENEGLNPEMYWTGKEWVGAGKSNRALALRFHDLDAAVAEMKRLNREGPCALGAFLGLFDADLEWVKPLESTTVLDDEFDYDRVDEDEDEDE